MDPSYSKAYGRMGLAHSSLEKHREAVENFKKALELEPDNESYKSNLQIAEDKVKSGVAPSGGMGEERTACLMSVANSDPRAALLKKLRSSPLYARSCASEHSTNSMKSSSLSSQTSSSNSLSSKCFIDNLVVASPLPADQKPRTID